MIKVRMTRRKREKYKETKENKEEVIETEPLQETTNASND